MPIVEHSLLPFYVKDLTIQLLILIHCLKEYTSSVSYYRYHVVVKKFYLSTITVYQKSTATKEGAFLSANHGDFIPLQITSLLELRIHRSPLAYLVLSFGLLCPLPTPLRHRCH